jgi:hypothetical protein
LWPEFLPDGRHFLYLVAHAGDAPPAIYVASLDGGAPTRVIESRFMARFAPRNRLLFVRDNELMSQPFDPDRLQLSGEPSLVVNTVLKTAAGRVAMSASRNGVLVYAAGVLSGDPTEVDQSETAWVNRTGRDVTPQPPSASVGNVGLQLSPNGTLLAFGRIRMGAGGVRTWSSGYRTSRVASNRASRPMRATLSRCFRLIALVFSCGGW